MDVEELRQIIRNFSFENCKNGNQGFSRILIQLFGFLGHGKSSFINTCKYVLDDGKYENIASAGSSHSGRTTDRVTYELTDNITLVDNRGCGKMDSYETGEIFAQLANLLPLNDRVEWSRGFQLVDRIVEAESAISKSDFIFPIFLYSLKKGIEASEIDDLSELLVTAKRMTGIFPIVVLTYKTHGNLTTIENTFRHMGVEQIYAFENYTPEDHIITRGRHEDILNFLYQVIKEVKFRVEQPRNPMQEMKDRKQFVLRFIYERELSLQGNQEVKRQIEQKPLNEIQQLKQKAIKEREEDRKFFEEEMTKLQEQFQVMRQSDERRFQAEMREYQREMEKMRKKDTCTLQ